MFFYLLDFVNSDSYFQVSLTENKELKTIKKLNVIID